jgi:hypothetical protein
MDFIPSYIAVSPRKIDCSVMSGGLAADLSAWVAVVVATAYVSWRICSGRRQLSLRSLFSATTAVAILLAWWRLEYARCLVAGNPAATALSLDIAETPMLRMLGFPPSVYIPVLVGVGCAILCMIDTASYLLGRVLARWHTLWRRRD